LNPDRGADTGYGNDSRQTGYIAASDLSRTSYKAALLHGAVAEERFDRLQVIDNERRIEMGVEQVYRQSLQMAHFVANRWQPSSRGSAARRSCNTRSSTLLCAISRILIRNSDQDDFDSGTCLAPSEEPACMTLARPIPVA
jgi:hypothetical protein